MSGASAADPVGNGASAPPGGAAESPGGAVVALRWWDLPAVVALEPVLFGADAWSAEMFWSELAQAGTRRYIAAWDGATLTGYAGSSVAAAEAWVQTIGVAPAYRRHGLATTLLLDLLDHARRRGAVTAWLEVGAGNHAAQQLYARHGFAAVSRRRGYYEATGEDALILRATL